MASDRIVRWCARTYGRLLSMLRGRDREERHAMRVDGEWLLRDAHAQGRLAVVTTWLALLWDLVIVGARHDLAQALRTCLRSPGLTIGTALILAVGVASTTTLFAFVDAVLLRPLPYDEPDRLVMLVESNVAHRRPREGVSPGTLLDLAARNDAFDAMTATMNVSTTLRDGGDAMPVTGVHVTRGFFDVFRRPARLGRTFLHHEFDGAASITSRAESSGERVLVLSDRLWRMLGADPQIVGRRVDVDGRGWRVIGVMPEDFAVPDAAAAFWAPWDLRVSYRGARFPHGPPRDARFLRVTGRMRAGVSLEGAAARLEAVADGLAAEHPDTNAGWTVRPLPLAGEIGRASRTELLVIFAAMACLLLLVCANVASLALARGVARAREMATRLAVGASPGRLTRLAIGEGVLSAGVTALVALPLSAWWVGLAVAVAPTSIPRLHEVGMNPRIAAFAIALTCLATVLGHAAPALRAGRTPIVDALKDGAAVTAGASGRLRAGLVVAEMATAVMLLVGAGLLARTFAELRRVDLGFDTHGLLVLRVTPDAARYRSDDQTNDYYRRVLEAIRAVPGVASVAAVTSLPMSGLGAEFTRPYWPEHTPPEGRSASSASIRMATPGYFKTLGLRLVDGREFTERDEAGAPRVVIVNETLARLAWGTTNPVTTMLMLDYQGGAYPYEVVGVVRDARARGPRSEPVPEIFIPHAQNPYLVMNVIARTTIDPLAVAASARASALAVDPDQPVHSVTTMTRLLADTVSLDRFATLLIALFATGGLITAACGVYALFAYTVVQRRREIALRMALGASPFRVARSIVQESLALAAAGTLFGSIGAVAAGRFLRALLFGVEPLDPVTFVAVVVTLALVAVAASWLPARRAARIDPIRVVRI